MAQASDSPVTDPPPALDYQPGRVVRQRRRRRRVLVLALVPLVAGLLLWKGPQVYRRAERAYWARQVATYRGPADQVVYEEDPSQWPALLARPEYFKMRVKWEGHPPAVAHAPHAVRRFVETHELRAGGEGVVFAHARRTPSGGKRTVIVWLRQNGARVNEKGTIPEDEVRMDFRVGVWDGQDLALSWVQPHLAPERIALDRKTPLYARLVAGQPDPDDPTHFTIALEMSEYFDVIDGHLRDDGSVVLRPRSYQHASGAQ